MNCVNSISCTVNKLVIVSTHIYVTVHLGKPKEVLGDGGGAALDLHQWDLIFGCDQDVILVVEHSRQVHPPDRINLRKRR